MEESSSLVCGKCGTPSSGELVCAACGGGMVKLCGKCRFKNSLKKNFCDRCGTSLAALPPPPAAGGDIPQTAVQRRAPAPAPEGGLSLPAAGRSMQSFEAPPIAPPPAASAPKKPAAPPAPPPKPWLPPGTVYFIKSVLSLLFVIVVVFAAAIVALQQKRALLPENVARPTAERWLAAVSRIDYPTGYPMLTRLARASCSSDDFRLSLGTDPWVWEKLTPVKAEADSVAFRFDHKPAQGPARAELLFLVLEDGHWMVPYEAALLKGSAEALSRNNPDIAVFQAQAAVGINPRDAAARTSLCAALRGRGVAAEADSQCALAAELSRGLDGSVPLSR